ncbi:MAG: peptidylprolyl isomerase [Anaerolineales bacterium]|nr:peptidylprolyl isomerase [Anaerolineales bacterium]MCB9128194.1 peptidylprolyl isomerase [Ardenticatenales bacterium]
MLIDTRRDYVATLQTTRGPIVIDLLESDAPNTVNNFVALAASGYYDNTPFHRVLDDFMAQGGDPTGTGRGGPGYSFADEQNGLTFDGAGIVAMANGGPNTNGSQFFITYAPTPHLNGAHTIFGRVIDGQANADALTRIDPQRPDPNVTADRIECVSLSLK